MTDRQQIKAFLDTDRSYHAYALADLADPYFGQCQWWAALNGPDIELLVLLFNDLKPPALLPMGGAERLPDILAQIELPSRVMVLGQAAGMNCLAGYYQFEYIDPMLRMSLSAADFQPVSGEDVVKLDESFSDELAAMYAAGHGNAFAPYQLNEGVFYGIFFNKRVVAVAGTHIVSLEYGVAAVGNIFTRPAHRGRGYAQQVTGAVCCDLLAQNLDVILNVEEQNASAVHVYKKLGFKVHCSFLEGVGELQ